MFTQLYNLILFLLVLIGSPKLLYQMIVHKKYRKSFFQRLGKNTPIVPKTDQPIIWIHGISMGETRAMGALYKFLKQKVPHAIFISSASTETGYAESERVMPDVHHRLYFPIDFSWIVKKVIRKINPSVVLMGEGDLWYNFLNEAKKNDAAVVLINGKVSQKSANRYQAASWFSKRLFGCFDLLCVQSEIYRNRFLQIGVPKEKVVATGNLKFDETPVLLSETEKTAYKKQLGFSSDDLILVIGSSHDPEEKLFIQHLMRVWKSHPSLKVILVPRHPERFDEVAGLLEKEKIPFVRWSSIESKKETEKVVLIDAMGQLRNCYQIADIALVAGSYKEKVDGHNILEPCWYGVPVVFGPHMQSQPDMLTLVESYQAGLSVHPENLAEVLSDLCASPEKRKDLGDRGKELVGSIQGSTLRTWEQISSLL